jgi:tetratricopeptide (TPR) repeat protein
MGEGAEVAAAAALAAVEAAFQRGDLEAARALAQRLLAAAPAHAPALHLAGLVAARAGDIAAAHALFARAVAADGRVALYHGNLGQAALDLGHTATALAAFDAALALEPRFGQAHLGRAAALERAVRLEDALAAYERALALGAPGAAPRISRGRVLARLRRHALALASCEEAARLEPGSALVAVARSAALLGLGRAAAALEAAERALALDAGLEDARLARLAALLALGRADEALADAERALATAPQAPRLHLARARALLRLHRFEAALVAADDALARAPALGDAHLVAGEALQLLGRLPAAAGRLDAALRADPDAVDAYCARGVVRWYLGDLDGARADQRAALARDGGLAEAHWNLALVDLAEGRYAQGWAGYEWRLRFAEPLARVFAGARWDGVEPLARKTLLVHAEQGLGDTLQFVRFVPRLDARGARVVLAVQPELVTLLARACPGVRVVALGAAGVEFDRDCPLLSLPYQMGTTLATLPATVPYLTADPRRVADWGRRLAGETRLRVGLVWAGGHRAGRPEVWAVNARRNLAFAELAALAHPDVAFYSQQKGAAAEAELAAARAAGGPGPPLVDLAADLVDFEDTAAVIENLDLVISVDTATAHLAGALGRPVWLLNRFDSCWRWLRDRDDSPWYPTLRLYRQARLGDWSLPLARVAADLARRAQARAAERSP